MQSGSRRMDELGRTRPSRRRLVSLVEREAYWTEQLGPRHDASGRPISAEQAAAMLEARQARRSAAGVDRGGLATASSGTLPPTSRWKSLGPLRLSSHPVVDDTISAADLRRDFRDWAARQKDPEVSIVNLSRMDTDNNGVPWVTAACGEHASCLKRYKATAE